MKRLPNTVGNKSKIARLENKKAAKLEKKDDALQNGNSFMQRGEPLAIYDSALEDFDSTKDGEISPVQRLLSCICESQKQKSPVSGFLLFTGLTKKPPIPLTV